MHRGSADVDTLLRRAGATPTSLSADDWTLLAGYGGWHDPDRRDRAGATLAALADVAPDPRLQRQFLLQAQAAGDDDAQLSPDRAKRLRAVLVEVLNNPAEVRASRSALTYGAVRLAHGAAPNDAAERQRIGDAIVAALDPLFADTRLVASERLSSTIAALALFRDRAGPAARVPAALLTKVRDRAAWADRSVTDAYERQAVISTVAELLAEAGERIGAERLLEGELKRSHTPYYYMPALAELAEARGDRRQALDWLRRGYRTAEGPASRVQWGVIYVEGLLRLSPDDHATIERATRDVIGELAHQPEGYRQRTRLRLEKLGKALIGWSRDHDGGPTIARLRTAGRQRCAEQRDPWAAAACRDWLIAADRSVV